MTKGLRSLRLGSIGRAARVCLVFVGFSSIFVNANDAAAQSCISGLKDGSSACSANTHTRQRAAPPPPNITINRGSGGGRTQDYTPALGAALGVLGTLLNSLDSGNQQQGSSSNQCSSGYGLCPDGGCAPLGSVCCGNGTHCGKGNICGANNTCIPINSGQVCSDGHRYCNAGYICGSDFSCIASWSDRVCSDHRSYCSEGDVCGTDNKCYSRASLEQKAEKEEKERQAAEEQQEREAAERQLKNAIANAIEKNVNPFASDSNPFGSGEPDVFSASANPFAESPARAGSSCSDLSGIDSGKSMDCGNKPSPAGPDAAAQSTCEKSPNAVSQDASPHSLADPCVRIPGWTPSEPYNHASTPSYVVIYQGGMAMSLEVPGASPTGKFGLWSEGGILLVKQWDGSAADINSSGPTDADHCAILRMSGWPKPECQMKREIENRDSAVRAIAASSRTAQQCRRIQGEIIDPNQDTISEETCAQKGGKKVPSPDNDWKAGSCYFAESKQFQRIRDISLPEHQCKVGRSPHFDYYNITVDANEDEANPFVTPR